MNITIKYCGMWGYKSKAQVVGDEILEAYPDAKVMLEVGSGGQFDVIYETRRYILFSKDEKHRFPEEGEIIGLIGRNENG